MAVTWQTSLADWSGPVGYFQVTFDLTALLHDDNVNTHLTS